MVRIGGEIWGIWNSGMLFGFLSEQMLLMRTAVRMYVPNGSICGVVMEGSVCSGIYNFRMVRIRKDRVFGFRWILFYLVHLTILLILFRQFPGAGTTSPDL